jgi:hypothetical protein
MSRVQLVAGRKVNVIVRNESREAGKQNKKIIDKRLFDVLFDRSKPFYLNCSLRTVFDNCLIESYNLLDYEAFGHRQGGVRFPSWKSLKELL